MTARAYLILVLFFIWSAFSWWWYTCKIKNLCPENLSYSSGLTASNDEVKSPDSKQIGEKELGIANDAPNDQGTGNGETEDPVKNNQGQSSEIAQSEKQEAELSRKEALENADEPASGKTEEIPIDRNENEGSENDGITAEKATSSSVSDEVANNSEENTIVRMEDKTVIYFEYLSDEPRLNNQAQNFLNQIANDLRNDKYKSIRVTGYTDNIGNPKNNYYKGLDRARAIQSYLINNGARENQVELKSFGEYQPIADNSTEEGRAKNRRVEIKLNY